MCNSIASALRGDFGNHHTTPHTSGIELFINPLMTQYWTFAAKQVLKHMEFAPQLAKTTDFAEAAVVLKTHRNFVDPRPRRALPL